MTQKTTLTTVDGREIEMDSERILTNDVTMPWEYNPHNIRLWIVCNEYGALGAVWAGNEQDALDTLVDEDLGAGILVDEADSDDECARLGNAGEPANLDNVGLYVVRLDQKLDARLMCAFCEARGAGNNNLWK